LEGVRGHGGVGVLGRRRFLRRKTVGESRRRNWFRQFKLVQILKEPTHGLIRKGEIEMGRELRKGEVGGTHRRKNGLV